MALQERGSQEELNGWALYGLENRGELVGVEVSWDLPAATEGLGDSL